MKKLNEKISGYEDAINKSSVSGTITNSSSDETIAKTYIPKAGKTSICIAIIIMIVILVVIIIKNKQYKDIH